MSAWLIVLALAVADPSLPAGCTSCELVYRIVQQEVEQISQLCTCGGVRCWVRRTTFDGVERVSARVCARPCPEPATKGVNP